MRKTFMSLLFTGFFLFAPFAQSADKVVVIPLGGAKNYMYWQGDWSSTGIDYKIGDGVQYEGSSYICVEKHYSTSSDSPPSAYWNLLASKGDTGSTGDQGLKGDKGDTGDQGIQGLKGDKGDTGDQGIQGVAGPIAGIDKQLAYNDSGSAAGAEVYYDKTTGNIGIGTSTPNSTLQVNGYVQLALTNGTPPATDCDETSERGRMIVDNVNGNGRLYVCVNVGWRSTTLGL